MSTDSGKYNEDDVVLAKKLVAAYEKITKEVGKAIVGQNDVLQQVMIAMLARGALPA